MKYFTYKGGTHKFRIFAEDTDTWVAANTQDHYTFKTREEALQFCKEQNKYYKTQFHFKTYKIKESKDF